MDPKMDELKKQLVKIYYRHDFELRANKEKVVDATMTEIALMIDHMMDTLYNQIKNKKY